MLDTGRWMLDAGYWALDAGRWILGAGCWALDAGYWKLAGNQIFFASIQKQVSRTQHQYRFYRIHLTCTYQSHIYGKNIQNDHSHKECIVIS